MLFRSRSTSPRSNSNVGIKRGEVERALETKIRFDLPSDRAVPLGVNRGNPAVLADPTAEFSKALRKMAQTLIPRTEVKRGRRRVFRGLARA